MISVVCPTYNEEKYITECIHSILQCDYPHQDMEVLFVDGYSKDLTRRIILEFASKHSFIKLIDNPEKVVPFALNKGIAEAKGDIIIRIDAHAVYEKNYFSTLVKYLYELNADNVGSICKTDVLHKTPKSLAIAEVLSNRFGVGNATFRIGEFCIKEVDTVPFGCWKKVVFEKYGYFNTTLIRNQDIEFNKRIKRGGGKIYLVPDTFFTYFARETYKDLAKNNYANGKWNILTVWFTKQIKSLSFRHFVPMFFLLSLLLPLFASLFYFPFIYLVISILVLYLGLCLILSISLSKQKHLNWIYLFLAFPVLHFSYGMGSLMGLICLVFIKK